MTQGFPCVFPQKPNYILSNMIRRGAYWIDLALEEH